MTSIKDVDFDTEEEFLRSNTKGWKHGVEIPREFFNYEISNHQYNDKMEFNSTSEIIFTPQASLQEIAPNRDSKPSKKTSNNAEKKYATEHGDKESDRKFFFSGYNSIPDIALNVNDAFEKSEKTKSHKKSLPKVCLQANFEYNDLSYLFGGVYIDEDMKLSELGIPDDTDLSKISVYIPSELPPLFNRNLLSNPFVVQNTIFWLFNPLRATLSAIDIPDFGDFPYYINSLVGCQISDSHFFFYGGFSVEIESVEYLEKIDRYVIKKKVIINDDGYILDIMTFKFIKIALKNSDDKDSKHKGRLGCAVTANRNEYTHDNEVPARVPSPPIFTDNSSINSDSFHSSTINQHVSHESLNKYLQKNESKASSSKGHVLQGDYETLTHQTSVKFKELHTQSSKERLVSPKVESITNFKKNPLLHQSGSSLSRQSSSTNEMNHKFLKTFGTKSPSSAKVSSSDGEGGVDDGHERISSPPMSSGIDDKPKLAPINTQTSFDNSDRPNSSAINYTDSSHSSNLKAHSVYDATDSINKVPSILKETASKNLFFNKSVVKPGYLTNAVFIFGGFQEKTDSDYQSFVATNDLTRIDLQFKENDGKIKFSGEGYIYSINEHQPGVSQEWPSPRAFFAFSLTNSSRRIDDKCQMKLHRTFNDTTSQHESSGIVTPTTTQSTKTKSSESFFAGKSLIIHGGIDEHSTTFADLFMFDFDTSKWQELNTFAYDYFNDPKSCSADEDISHLTKDNEIDSPQLVEAEMRACFHTTLYYRNEDHDYLFFVGGFRNDYLRFVDKESYDSPKMDVSRLARFQLDTDNPNTERIAVLNLQSQTWRFLRYYTSGSSVASPTDKDFSIKPYWKNSRLSNFFGVATLIGKNITLIQGLMNVVPEKAEVHESLKKDYPIESFIWGGIVSFTFPSL